MPAGRFNGFEFQNQRFHKGAECESFVRGFALQDSQYQICHGEVDAPGGAFALNHHDYSLFQAFRFCQQLCFWPTALAPILPSCPRFFTTTSEAAQTPEHRRRFVHCLVTSHIEIDNTAWVSYCQQMVPANWRHPEEDAARRRVSEAVKDGRLIRPRNCDVCDRVPRSIEGHHADYSKPLKVEWLCKRCHKAADERDHPKNCYRRRMRAVRYKRLTAITRARNRHFAATKAAKARWKMEAARGWRKGFNWKPAARWGKERKAS